MFSEALKKVEKYTLPVIYSQKLANGQIVSGCGAFIVLNPEGWILTAAHIVQNISLAEQHKPELEEFKRKTEAIANNPNLNDKAKRKAFKALPKNPKWIVNQAMPSITFTLTRLQIWQLGN